LASLNLVLMYSVSALAILSGFQYSFSITRSLSGS
jgi:hypothetical protein